MARLVDDLLLLARAHDNGVRHRRQDLALDDIFYTERERLGLEYPDLAVRATLEPARVTGDADALMLAVRNLIDNSARHATRNITMGVRSHDGEAEIEGLLR